MLQDSIQVLHLSLTGIVGDKIAMMCIYCDKIVRGGGINRLKDHLAGKMGQVSLCKKVSPDVRYQMKQNIEENKSKNKKRRIDEEHDFIHLVKKVVKCQ